MLWINYSKSFEEKCTSCLLGTSNFISSYQCNYKMFDLNQCVQYINNDLGSIICGTIYQEGIMNYINQQCFNKVPIPMLARNIAIGICYPLCKCECSC